MNEHHIDLTGPACFGRFARPEAVGRVLSCIAPMARESVRMSVLHSSRIAGRPWRELTAAWDIRYGGQTKSPDGGTRLVFTAPSLIHAAPMLFEQHLLFADGPSADDTAFDLMGDMLGDVGQMKRESARFDADLLSTLLRFGAAVKRGVQSILLGGHRLDHTMPPPIDRRLIAAASELVEETPKPQRVRITGRLDMVRVSDRAFELLLEDGQHVRAVWAQPSVAHLGEYLGRPVVVEGQAVFRPSGSVLRIDAEAIAQTQEVDAFFSRLPEAKLSMRRAMEQSTAPRKGASAFAAIYGQWPGEESEEQLVAALEEIS